MHGFDLEKAELLAFADKVLARGRAQDQHRRVERIVNGKFVKYELDDLYYSKLTPRWDSINGPIETLPKD